MVVNGRVTGGQRDWGRGSGIVLFDRLRRNQSRGLVQGRKQAGLKG